MKDVGGQASASDPIATSQKTKALRTLDGIVLVIIHSLAQKLISGESTIENELRHSVLSGLDRHKLRDSLSQKNVRISA